MLEGLIARVCGVGSAEERVKRRVDAMVRKEESIVMDSFGWFDTKSILQIGTIFLQKFGSQAYVSNLNERRNIPNK